MLAGLPATLYPAASGAAIASGGGALPAARLPLLRLWRRGGRNVRLRRDWILGASQFGLLLWPCGAPLRLCREAELLEEPAAGRERGLGQQLCLTAGEFE